MVTHKKKEARVRELRRRGLELVSHDQFEKAAPIYVELTRLEPEEGDWARRAADCFWQLKDERSRLKYCVLAAEAFCDSGFLLKAIAMCKVVLSLDPTHQETQQRLARLYAKQPGHGENSAPVPELKTVEVPPPTGRNLDRPRPVSKGLDARKRRARLAAAAALRQIRAQRRAQRDILFDSSGPEHPEQPPSSRAALSIATTELQSPLAKAAPQALAPSVPPIVSPKETNRSPSLHAISLRAHLPSIQRTLSPKSPHPAYSLNLSQPPPLGGSPELKPGALMADRGEVRRLSQLAMLEPSPEVLTPAVESTRADPFPASLSLAPITTRPPPPPLDPAPETIDLRDEDSLFAQVEHIPLFGDLGHDALVKLIDRLELVELPPNEILFSEGDLADAMYVVSEGAVVAEVDRDDGTTLVLAELDEGEFFGEIGLLSDQPRQARVRARGACRLLRIERQVVSELMEIDERFLATLLEFLRARLVDSLVQTSPLFAGLPREERFTLAQSFDFLELDEDTALLVPGERPLGMYVLLAGSALAYRPRGRPQLVHLGPGAIFGQGPLLDNSLSREEVRTTNKSFALCLDTSRFRELIMTHPTVLEYVSSLQSNDSDAPDLGDHVTLY